MFPGLFHKKFFQIIFNNRKREEMKATVEKTNPIIVDECKIEKIMRDHDEMAQLYKENYKKFIGNCFGKNMFSI